MTNPQPMQVRRRGGAKRGDHGTYVAPTTPPAAAVTETETVSGAIGSDKLELDSGTRRRRRAPATGTEAQNSARAAYDRKPKVIVRGVDEDVYFKLRAVYKHQLRSPDGIEGWSEFGRQLLRDYVDAYENEHGEMTGGETVTLNPGAVARD